MKRVRKTTVWLKSLLVSAVAVVLLEMFEKFKVFEFSCKRSQSSLQLEICCCHLREITNQVLQWHAGTGLVLQDLLTDRWFILLLLISSELFCCSSSSCRQMLSWQRARPPKWRHPSPARPDELASGTDVPALSLLCVLHDCNFLFWQFAFQPILLFVFFFFFFLKHLVNFPSRASPSQSRCIWRDGVAYL